MHRLRALMRATNPMHLLFGSASEEADGIKSKVCASKKKYL